MFIDCMHSCPLLSVTLLRTVSCPTGSTCLRLIDSWHTLVVSDRTPAAAVHMCMCACVCVWGGGCRRGLCLCLFVCVCVCVSGCLYVITFKNSISACASLSPVCCLCNCGKLLRMRLADNLAIA